MLPADKSTRIIDVGAGTGYFCKVLQDQGYKNVEACDMDKESFGLPSIPFYQANLNEHIPVEDEQFDLSVSIEVVEHIENQFNFIKEMMRVTKVGGTLIITTPNTTSLISRIYFLLYGYSDAAPYPIDPHVKDFYLKHIHPISITQLLLLIERNNGEIVELTTNRFRPKTLFLYYLVKPVLSLLIRMRFLRKKSKAHHDLYKRHINLMVSEANLRGRITIIKVKRVR